MCTKVERSAADHADSSGLQPEPETPMPRHQAGHWEKSPSSSALHYRGLTGDGVGGPRTEEVLRGSIPYAPPRSSLAPHVAGRSVANAHVPPVGLLPADRSIVYLVDPQHATQPDRP